MSVDTCREETRRALGEGPRPRAEASGAHGRGGHLQSRSPDVSLPHPQVLTTPRCHQCTWGPSWRQTSSGEWGPARQNTPGHG